MHATSATHLPAKSRKSYWGAVSRRCYFGAAHRVESGQFGDGRDFATTNLGSDSKCPQWLQHPAKAGGMTKDERFVIFASSLGTVFEWYDFYLFGSLASIIGAQFFGVIDPATNQPMFTQATRDIFALLAFAAGFIVRPFGAIVFGRIGDIVGRKYTFLVTILIMGLSTFIVGLLPNAATIGIAAPIILIAPAPAAGSRARRRIWRCGDLRGGAFAAWQARLLHLVHSDDGDARPVPVAAGDPVHPHDPRRSGIRRIGAGAFRSWSRSSCSASRSGSG